MASGDAATRRALDRVHHVELVSVTETSHRCGLPGLAQLEILRANAHELFVDKPGRRIVRWATGVARHSRQRLVVRRDQRQRKLSVLPPPPAGRQSVRKKLPPPNLQI